MTPDRNLAVELVRVTEAAAMAAARWVGRGDKLAADQAAVDAMRLMLDTVEMDGVVVIGEGEKDEAPMLFNGERVGTGRGPAVDIAVDPLEGTELTALGEPNAISVIAVAERGSMFFPGATAAFYMEKLAVGPEAAAVIDLGQSAAANVLLVAEAKRKTARDVSVVVLNRPRNEALIAELRGVGASVHLIRHGDTEPAIAAARRESGVDMVMGIGGTTEGVIAAAALKALGGAFHGRFWLRDDDERRALAVAGHEGGRIFTTDDLVRSDNVFVAATGVTTGALLLGVAHEGDTIRTESLVMRSRSGTVRRVTGEHTLEKLERFTGREYR